MKKGKTTPLDEVCNVEYGTRVVQKRDGGSVYPVYGGGGATFKMDEFNRKDRLVIARFGMSEECTRFVGGKFFLNDSGLTVSPKNGSVLQRFLDYQMLSLNDHIYALGKGTAQKNLDVPVFRSIPLFVPNDILAQQRIVGILDEAFESIAVAKASAEKNSQNARALFESHIQSVFTQRGKGWLEKPIAECFKVRSGDFLPAKAMVETGVFNVYGGNGINGRHDKKNLSGENIIIGRVGAKCGNIHHVNGDAWVTDNALLISDYLCPFDLRFLTHLLRLKDLRSRANQMAQPVISFTTIKDVLLEFPASKIQQTKIARAVADLAVETQHLASVYERKLAALEALKKSLLHQAFAGQL